MSAVSAVQVRELRDKTGAGMMDCKRALAESGGDIDKAVVYLREKGLAAAANPRYLRREEVPADAVAAERSIYQAQASSSGKPAAVVDKIVDGKLEKFFQDTCLVEQPFIKEPQRSVEQVVTDAVARIGENVVVRRFARFQLGELTEQSA